MKAKNISTLCALLMVLGLQALLMACSGQHEQGAKLDRIDSLMNDHPDSALTMLDSLKAEKANWSKSLRMRYDMLHLKAENKAFVPLTSDSIAKKLVDYYDAWGNANEQMLAHYLLGCVYRDKGDSPRAISAYQNAISKADTTANDCDYKSLGAVYSQMAALYHQQFLLVYEIEALRKACRYDYQAKDTLRAINDLDKIAGVYILRNQRDSAELVLKEVLYKYIEHGYPQKAIKSSTKLIYLYVEGGEKLAEAKQLIDRYETESDAFDNMHILHPSRRQYYYYKGKYYEDINKLDSAEFFYRQVYHPNMSYAAQDPMYRGLLSVFTKRHQADSIAKYAQLYCEANDSSIAKKDQELTAKMAVSYNYSLYQKEALESESKANIARLILVSFLFFVLFCSIILWKRYKDIRKRKQEEIENLKAQHIRAAYEYSRNIYTMQLIDKTRKQDIELMKKDNDEYENKMTELIEENKRLEETIKHVEQQKGITQYLHNTTEFMKTDIVKYLKDLELKPLSAIKEEDWVNLDTEVSKYFPNLLLDLHNSPKVTKQKKQVCLLVIIKISDSCIANWLNLKPNRISNIKLELNEMLFGESSARTLYTKLSQKYNIIISGE